MGLFVLAAFVLGVAGLVSVVPGDPAYADVCMNFNSIGKNPQPSVVHFVESAAEVSQILRSLHSVRFLLVFFFFFLPYPAPHRASRLLCAPDDTLTRCRALGTTW